MSATGPQCPQCASTALEVTHRQSTTKHDRTFIGDADGWRCTGCGHEFGKPREAAGVIGVASRFAHPVDVGSLVNMSEEDRDAYLAFLEENK